MTGEVHVEPLHAAVLPDDGKAPAEWTLAEWQGLLEELDYQADNVGRQQHSGALFATAHDALAWLVAFFMARRLNG